MPEDDPTYPMQTVDGARRSTKAFMRAIDRVLAEGGKVEPFEVGVDGLFVIVRFTAEGKSGIDFLDPIQAMDLASLLNAAAAKITEAVAKQTKAGTLEPPRSPRSPARSP
jgi:hypothetical protein